MAGYGMFGGGSFGFDDALRAKYAALAQQASAQMLEAKAAARLNDTRSDLMPAESAAGIGKTNAEAALTRENTKFVGPLANASIFNTRSQGALYGQQAIGEAQLNGMNPSPFTAPRRGPGLGGTSSEDDFSAKIRSMLKEGLGY